MGPDVRDHCHRFVNRDDPVAAIRDPDEPGAFKRRARAPAWTRAMGQAMRALTTGKTGYRRGTGARKR